MTIDKSDVPPQDRLIGYLTPLAQMDGYYGMVAMRARDAEVPSLEIALGLAAAAAKRLLRCPISKLSYVQARGLLAHLVKYHNLVSRMFEIAWDQQNLALPHVQERLNGVTLASQVVASQLNELASTFDDSQSSESERVKQEHEQALRQAELVAALDRKQSEMDARIREEMVRAHEVFRAAETARQSYETLAQSLQAPAAKATSRANAKHFLAQARWHRESAKFWAKSVVWTTIATVAFAILCFFVPMFRMPEWLAPHLSVMSTTTHVHVAVGKVLTFSTLVYAIFFFARNYMAQVHNAVVNDHRANALKTYEVIIAAVGDSHKDTVLTKASDCIFGPQPTGFTKHEVTDTPAVAFLANVATTATRGQQTQGT